MHGLGLQQNLRKVSGPVPSEFFEGKRTGEEGEAGGGMETLHSTPIKLPIINIEVPRNNPHQGHFGSKNLWACKMHFPSPLEL